MREGETGENPAVTTTRTRRRAASRPAGPPVDAGAAPSPEDPSPAEASGNPASAAAEPARKTKQSAGKASGTARGTRKKATKTTRAAETSDDGSVVDDQGVVDDQVKSTATADAAPTSDAATDAAAPAPGTSGIGRGQPQPVAPASATSLLFQAPDPAAAPEPAPTEPTGARTDRERPDEEPDGDTQPRRRSRGGRGGRAESKPPTEVATDDSDTDTNVAGDEAEPSESSRRRRRRRRGGDDSGSATTEAKDAAPVARKARAKQTDIASVEGSTRMEAKKQRRREGREAGRRRPPILTESEFLARRESVDRMMVIRQHGEVTQIAVLEDNVLVEHYVNRESQSSMIGNVYLGRVQNVLPSMEAAFIDLGRGRNAVLYAGEVNWDLLADGSTPHKIEAALKPGQSVLVQVSKDPVGHKGARLTSQVSLPGRYLVYVPDGTTNGISRKLSDTERNRLKNLLKDILPDEAGVIIRTAAEGASEEELTRDVTRLTAMWDNIEKKAKSGKAPQLLYAEPDTTIKVVRDLFTEDFTELVVSGDDAWDMVDGYVSHVAPHLKERLKRYDGDGDVFSDHRVGEQIAKALEQKVWLPSGGSLVIDRTEAMTVVDVNTGKFTGSGGNLEETVTKNNLEAAEEIVRQLRLRDIGGIIVVDFIDMVLESNRDLVLRRLVECLGRDRTRHQVAEVTSLGLVQMTRKRIGTGLLEAFGEPCEHCHGRGIIVHSEPVEPKTSIGRAEHDGRGSDGRRRKPAAAGRSSKGSSSTVSDDSGAGPPAAADDAEEDRATALPL